MAKKPRQEQQQRKDGGTKHPQCASLCINEGVSCNIWPLYSAPGVVHLAMTILALTRLLPCVSNHNIEDLPSIRAASRHSGSDAWVLEGVIRASAFSRALGRGTRELLNELDYLVLLQHVHMLLVWVFVHAASFFKVTGTRKSHHRRDKIFDRGTHWLASTQSSFSSSNKGWEALDHESGR